MSKLSDTEIKQEIFVERQIRESINDPIFEERLNSLEIPPWICFKSMVKDYLGNNKTENYKDLIGELSTTYRTLGYNISLKIHFCILIWGISPKIWKQ